MQEPDAAEVARALESVYARPEFEETSPPWLVQLLSDLREAVTELLFAALERLVSFLGETVPEGWMPAISQIFLALLVLAAVLALAYILVGAGRRRSRLPPDPAAGGAPEGSSGPPLDAEGWEALAERAAGDGRFRDAAIALYRSVLVRLQDQGALQVRPTKTPGDYRRELATRDTHGPGFEAFLRPFLPLAFGSGRGDPGAFGRLVHAAQPLGVRLSWNGAGGASPDGGDRTSGRTNHDRGEVHG